MFALLGLQLLVAVGLARNINDASVCNYYDAAPIGPCYLTYSNGTYSISSEFYCNSGMVYQNTYLGTNCSGKLLYGAQSASLAGVDWNCGGQNDCPVAWVTLNYCKGHQNWWLWQKEALVMNTCSSVGNLTSVIISCSPTRIKESLYLSSSTCTGTPVEVSFAAGVCQSDNLTYTIECGDTTSTTTPTTTTITTTKGCSGISLGWFVVVLLFIFQLLRCFTSLSFFFFFFFNFFFFGFF